MRFFFLFFLLVFGFSAYSQNHSFFYSVYNNDNDWMTVNLCTSSNGTLGIVSVGSSSLKAPFSCSIDSAYAEKDFFVFGFTKENVEYGLIITKDFQNCVFVDSRLVETPFYKPILLTYIDNKKAPKKDDGLSLESLAPLLKLFLF